MLTLEAMIQINETISIILNTFTYESVLAMNRKPLT